MNTFYQMIKAVEENNSMNDGQWKDCDDIHHLFDVYGDIEESDYKEVAKCFLGALIRDNGENLEQYKSALRCLEYGLA